MEYTGNTNRAREELAEGDEKKVTKVTSAPVKVQKKTWLDKFLGVFISDSAGNASSYVVDEILIPAAKKAISDVVTKGIDIILYGEDGVSSRSDSRVSRVSYEDYYGDRRSDRSRHSVIDRSSREYDYGKIVIQSRQDAELVLEEMDNLIRKYRVASVADLYDLVDISPRYTDNKYGWTDLRSAQIIRVADGFMLRLPKAMPLD